MDWKRTFEQTLFDLRTVAFNLRRHGKYEEAKHLDGLANDLDPNELKPASMVPRTTS